MLYVVDVCSNPIYELLTILRLLIPFQGALWFFRMYLGVFGQGILDTRCIWLRSVFYILLKQCWTVGTIFTFGRSRMFGPDKLRPLAVGHSRRFKMCLDQQTFILNRWIWFYIWQLFFFLCSIWVNSYLMNSLIKKECVLILKIYIIIHNNLI